MANDMHNPGTHHLRLQFNGLDRHALVHVPPGMPADSWPVVLMLHGAGGTSQWMLLETHWDEEAEREKFVVVLPDATLPQPDLPLQFFKNPQVWNDGSGLPPASWVHVDDVAFLRALLDELPKYLPMDTARLYVTGFSNGASMAFRLGLELSDRIAAIAPVAGYCWQRAPKPDQSVPALYLVGDRDPLVPLEGATWKRPGASASASRRCARPSAAGQACSEGRRSRWKWFPKMELRCNNSGQCSKHVSLTAWAIIGPAAAVV
jgi:polyhydroxybutyrate depolymerase